MGSGVRVPDRAVELAVVKATPITVEEFFDLTGSGHGTVNRYMNLKCRCEKCHEGYRAYENFRRGSPEPIQ
jgi:hypothetical protein